MNFISYIHSVAFQSKLRNQLFSVLMVLGIVHTICKAPASTTERVAAPSKRTYYVVNENFITSRKPREEGVKTIRATSLVQAYCHMHARMMEA